ncbi:hypothetical protein AK812_SmicGene30310 [Symbiodinium microadriaticum]|uniref:C2 domain-containing protein n=1 Tax=Symbiodinium microadriaticum TaxID=2951 RepID=A0A1Q9CZM3_SYMMI|nr:hypothetical protein AK812_SmicGene30310 [Symbiodinium microadriaticum]
MPESAARPEEIVAAAETGTVLTSFASDALANLQLEKLKASMSQGKVFMAAERKDNDDISDTGMNPAANPTTQREIMALANAAMVAAQALQASAEAMCAASIRSSGGFAEANKVLKYPEPFGSENHDGDVLAWHDWCHGFKAWIIFAQPEYDTELELIEESVEQEVSLAETAAKTRMRSLKLYAILSDDVPMVDDPEDFTEPPVEDRDPDMQFKNFVVQREMLDEKIVAHTLEREMLDDLEALMGGYVEKLDMVNDKVEKVLEHLEILLSFAPTPRGRVHHISHGSELSSYLIARQACRMEFKLQMKLGIHKNTSASGLVHDSHVGQLRGSAGVSLERRSAVTLGVFVDPRGLPKMDSLSLSDPFAVVKAIKGNNRTINAARQMAEAWYFNRPNTLTPVWDEEFDFAVAPHLMTEVVLGWDSSGRGNEGKLTFSSMGRSLPRPDLWPCHCAAAPISLDSGSDLATLLKTIVLGYEVMSAARNGLKTGGRFWTLGNGAVRKPRNSDIRLAASFEIVGLRVAVYDSDGPFNSFSGLPSAHLEKRADLQALTCKERDQQGSTPKVTKVVPASTLAAVAVVTVAVDSVVPAAVLVAVSMHTVVKDCVVLVSVVVPVAAVAVEVDSVVLVSVPVVVAAQVS